MKYEVGQVLWLNCPERYRASGPITITKVGRKWAEYCHLDERGRQFRRGKFSMETGYVDCGGYTPVDKVWPSEEAYTAWEVRLETWRKLRDWMSRGAPASVTTQDICAAAKLLGMPVEP